MLSNRTGGRNRTRGLCTSSASRGDDASCGRSPRERLAGRARMVRGELPRADASSDGRLGPSSAEQLRSSTPRRGAARPLRPSCGLADHTGARPEPATGPRHAGHVRVSMSPPQGADVRRRAQPPRPADRHRAGRPAALGEEPPRITVASRTGDTPADDRRELARRPPDILITTPSCTCCRPVGARDPRGVEHVIIDEVTPSPEASVARILALVWNMLERLRGDDAPVLQRIGLSATQRPLEAIARFLGGIGSDHEVAIVDAGTSRSSCGSSQSRTCPASARCSRPTSRPGGRPSSRTCARASGRPSTRPSSSSSASTTARSSSPTPRRLSRRLAIASTSWRARSSSRAHHGSIARDNACTSRRSSRRAASRRSSRPRVWSWASTWARSAWSPRSNRRRAWRAGCSGSAGPNARSAHRARGSSSRSTATCSNTPWSPAHASSTRSRATRSTSSPSSSWR